ncbi:MAG: DUF2332 domain-containing protein [Alphaproteobacteria bacterium]|nr:DUF2332 domain-containing protein [Alphaproteobacteria bacterium]
MTDERTRREAAREAFSFQVKACAELDAPFTGAVCAALIRALDGEGEIARIVDGFELEPLAAALSLRLCGALHFLARRGDVPALAGLYAQAGAAPDPAALDAAVAEAARRFPKVFADYVGRAVQTNEVMRSSALAPGYLATHAVHPLPLRCLEIGASAGLNLAWDRYRYSFGGASWGRPESPLHLVPRWEGPPPPLGDATVAERAGCDLAPMDLGDAEERARARSYVWAEQAERLGRFDAAAGLAARSGIRVEKIDAGKFLARELARPRDGQLTVVAHSVVYQYLSPETREAFRRALESAGARADARSPLGWLRLEPNPETFDFEVRLTLWPGGVDRRLAVAHPHGAWVRWEGLAP